MYAIAREVAASDSFTKSILPVGLAVGLPPAHLDRALNERNRIKAETRERILQTATQYGYRRTACNSKYREGTPKQIGVIVFNLYNEYFSRLLMEIESVCREIGYSTIVMFTNYDSQCEIENIRRIYGLGVDGIILAAVNSGQEFENYLKAFDIPIVAVGIDIKSIPYVGIDDFAAMKALTEHVMQNEYNNIIYFSPAIQYKDAYAQKRRFEGFIAAIPQQLSYSVIVDIEKVEKNYSEDTVIICSTDYYALKVYFRAKGAAIVGFDNVDILDKYQIPITSVDYSLAEIAKESVIIIVNKTGEGKEIGYLIVNRFEEPYKIEEKSARKVAYADIRQSLRTED